MSIRSGKVVQAAIWLALGVLLAALALLSSQALAEGEGEASSSASASVSQEASSASTSSSSGAGQTSEAEAVSGSSAASESEERAPSKTSAVDQALGTSRVPDNTVYVRADTDSAGTLFTFETPLAASHIGGDLYWAGDKLQLSNSRIGNDLAAFARDISLASSDVGGDVRVSGQGVHFVSVAVQGTVDVLAFDIGIDKNSAARGYYCGGGHISYEGASKRFIAYGQSIYFNGIVEGDVTLSAQEIVIGENAVITGTLDIRSGQNAETLSIPKSAKIGSLDTTLNQPNTIDQITQLRALIAPYFQVGSMLFLVVAFILLGLAMLWCFGRKLTEANRLIRRYPLAVVVLGSIAIMLMLVVIMLGPLLIFTIPFSIVAAMLLLICIVCCIPFTGASLALILRERIHPVLCVILGAAVGGALAFVPYVNLVVLIASLVYFVGYAVNISMFGHDKYHDSSYHHRQADEDAPSGRAHGILPVNADIAAYKKAEVPSMSGEALDAEAEASDEQPVETTVQSGKPDEQ